MAQLSDYITGFKTTPPSFQQMERCLLLWLEKSELKMPKAYQKRAIALMMRYFEHEEDCSDQLVMSFLHHFGGLGYVEIDDIDAVKYALAETLKKTHPSPQSMRFDYPLMLLVVSSFCLIAFVFVYFFFSADPITRQQAESLRDKTQTIVLKAQNDCEMNIRAQTLWDEIVKKPYALKSYLDLKQRHLRKTHQTFDAFIADPSFCARVRLLINAP